MIIYKSTTSEFDLDVRYNKIVQKLEDEFLRILGRGPSASEKRAFANSLGRMRDVLENEGLEKKDCGVLIEYQLPSSSMRLDFMITGKDKFMNENAVIVELKQWETVKAANTEHQVYTYTGGDMREVNHPAVQVTRYKRYLEDYQTAFHQGIENAIKLYACSYLHNYKKKIDKDEIINDKFEAYIDEAPVFLQEDIKRIGGFIKNHVEEGDGMTLIRKIENSVSMPSPKLIDQVNGLLDAKSEFILVDDQLVIFDRVMQLVKSHRLDGSDGHFVVIVKGGPGTGKSVVGLNLLGKILKEKKECIYLAANAAFKNGLANKLDATRDKALFKHPYFYNKDLLNDEKTFQTAIIDEAHRISETPPPMQKKLDQNLLEGIIEKTQLSVFFTDDEQMIRPKDMGSYENIRKAAEKLSCEIFEYDLKAQFRCAGSEGYINWLKDVLGMEKTANASGWENLDGLEFKIFDDPNQMKRLIQEKQELGSNARLVAGYAWPWSKELEEDGSLVSDVKIYKDDELLFEMPWNPQDAYKGQKRAKGIPSSSTDWAVEPIGVNQIGCIHTCQGLDFEYVGVIIGDEFTYDLEKECWRADVSKCFDKKIGKNSQKDFLRLAKNTYKTLLTRGIKGIYVYSTDPDTRIYLKRRLKVVSDLEEQRFYHKKEQSISEIFGLPEKKVGDAFNSYGDRTFIKINRPYNLGGFGERYLYCDFEEEGFVYDQLKRYASEKQNKVDDDMHQWLEDEPLIRNYAYINGQFDISLDGWIQLKPLVLIKHLVKGEKVIGFLCEKDKIQ